MKASPVFGARLVAGSVAIWLGTSQAAAQQAPTASADGPAAQSLEDIVVTAQRRRERLQDVPLSVTAVTADTASAVGVTGTSDLSLVVPAVSFLTAVNGGGVTIRGVGGSTATGDEPPNAIYVDGVYQAFAPAFLSGYNNIERVEVLKGPQGTLFGRNASGGVVQIITRAPSFDTHVNASVGYGSYESVDGNLYATTGLTDNLAIDVAAAGQRMGDGYGTNIATGKDVYKGYSASLRSKLLWKIGGNTTATLIGLYSKAKPWESDGGQIWPGYVDRSGGRGAGFRDVNRNDDTSFTIEQAQGSLTVVHEASWAELTSITSYDYSRQTSTFDQDGSPLNLLAFDNIVASRTWTQEARVQSLPHSRVNWIAGVYIYDNTVRVEPILVRGAAAAAFGGSYRYESKAPINSYAGFGQLSLPLGKTTFTLGGRYTLDDKRIDIAVLNSVGTPIPLAFSSNPRSASKTFTKFTYRLAVDHKITPDVLVYASLNTGFKAGAYGLVSLSPAGTTPQTTFPDPVAPQTVTAYEIGLKSELFDRKLRFNVSAYYYNVNQIQLRVAVPGGTVLLNAAKARNKGVDIDAAWRVSPRLTLQGAASYLDGRYLDFPNPPYFRPIVNAAGVATGGLVQFTGANAKGNREINSPKFVGSFIVDYKLPTSIGDFGVTAAYEYNDGYFFDSQNIFRSASRKLVSGTLRFSPTGGRFQLSVYAKNLLNEKYIINNNTSTLGPLYWSSAPRTYGARISYQF